MKKAIEILSSLILFLSTFSEICINKASAESFAPEIIPYLSAYIAEGKVGNIVSRETVFDLTEYNGKSGTVKVTDEYTIAHAEDTTLTYPVISALQKLDEVMIEVNGEQVNTEVTYGQRPLIFTGQQADTGWMSTAVYPTELEAGTATIYEFDKSETPLHLSFSRNEGQSVFYSGYGNISQGKKNYSVTIQNNNAHNYRLYVTEGELPKLESNAPYTKESMSYSELIQPFAEDLAEIYGIERAVGYTYSRFNQYMHDRFMQIDEVLFERSNLLFCTFNAYLPASSSETKVIIHSFVEPIINPSYEPFIYGLRIMTGYSKSYAYTLRINGTENFPYLIESDMTFEDNIHTAQKVEEDSYFIFSANKNPTIKIYENTQNHFGWLIVICIIVLSISLGTLIFSIVRMIRGQQKT